MRIIFLTQRLPYAPNRGDRIRAFHELRALAAEHKVHVVSLAHDAEEASHRADLQGIAASVSVARVPRVRTFLRGTASLLTKAPLTHSLLHSPSMRTTLEGIVRREDPDLVLAYCSSMARYALQGPLAGLPLILDMVDVDSAKWKALSEKTSGLKRWIYARESIVLAEFEARAAAHAWVTYVVNAREAELLRERAGSAARIEVLENGIDVEYFRPPSPTETTHDVVFTGVMNYQPNEEGAAWLVREVWPLVLAVHPDARLFIVGATPSRRVRSLAVHAFSVVVTGTVPDVRPYLWKSAVMAAPLLVARGVQNKVLEAVAAGLPAVVTPQVSEGLPNEVLPACRVESSPGDFARALVELLHFSPKQRQRLVEGARLSRLAWGQRLKPMLSEVSQQPSEPRNYRRGTA